MSCGRDTSCSAAQKTSTAPSPRRMIAPPRSVNVVKHSRAVSHTWYYPLSSLETPTSEANQLHAKLLSLCTKCEEGTERPWQDAQRTRNATDSPKTLRCFALGASRAWSVENRAGQVRRLWRDDYDLTSCSMSSTSHHPLSCSPHTGPTWLPRQAP